MSLRCVHSLGLTNDISLSLKISYDVFVFHHIKSSCSQDFTFVNSCSYLSLLWCKTNKWFSKDFLYSDSDKIFIDIKYFSSFFNLKFWRSFSCIRCSLSKKLSWFYCYGISLFYKIWSFLNLSSKSNLSKLSSFWSFLKWDHTVKWSYDSWILWRSYFKELFNSINTWSFCCSGNSTIVESIKSKLSWRFSNRLSSNHSYRNSNFYHISCSKVHSITLLADTRDTMTSQRTSYFDSRDFWSFNQA